jgi:hypothetical protein
MVVKEEEMVLTLSKVKGLEIQMDIVVLVGLEDC